jgi:hypothetical protein
MKRLNIFFQDQEFGYRVAFKCSQKDYDHSLVLVCTRGVFGHLVMFGGGDAYTTHFVCVHSKVTPPLY